MSDKFCFECGAKCVKIETGKFSTVDGSPQYRYRCPSGKCGHFGIVHAAPIVSAKGFFAWLNGAKMCPVCGKTAYKGLPGCP